jgi:Na+/glutamate symporter
MAGVVRVLAFILASAAMCVVTGSYLWAWASEEFWDSVPLYPCAVAAGVLAGSALYVARGRLVRAGALGVAASLATLLGTAVITLARWGN